MNKRKGGGDELEGGRLDERMKYYPKAFYLYYSTAETTIYDHRVGQRVGHSGRGGGSPLIDAEKEGRSIFRTVHFIYSRLIEKISLLIIAEKVIK